MLSQNFCLSTLYILLYFDKFLQSEYYQPFSQITYIVHYIAFTDCLMIWCVMTHLYHQGLTLQLQYLRHVHTLHRFSQTTPSKKKPHRFDDCFSMDYPDDSSTKNIFHTNLMIVSLQTTEMTHLQKIFSTCDWPW